MKKVTYSFVALLALMLCSCSNISEDERLIYVEPSVAVRKVLIEDFTGQRCTNCPKATEAIHEIQKTYGDNVVAVAIHCGPFGFAGNAKNIGLMTELGQKYWDAWFDSSQGQPVAKVNRGTKSETYANWSTIVRDELAKNTAVHLELLISGSDSSYTVRTSILAPAGYSAKLQLWLVEDSIVAMQMQPDGSTNKEYVHNHVLREALNGTWGEVVEFNEAMVTKETVFTLNGKYVADHCSVVAFVYDDNGVQQVESVGLGRN